MTRGRPSSWGPAAILVAGLCCVAVGSGACWRCQRGAAFSAHLRESWPASGARLRWCVEGLIWVLAESFPARGGESAHVAEPAPAGYVRNGRRTRWQCAEFGAGPVQADSAEIHHRRAAQFPLECVLQAANAESCCGCDVCRGDGFVCMVVEIRGRSGDPVVCLASSGGMRFAAERVELEQGAGNVTASILPGGGTGAVVAERCDDLSEAGSSVRAGACGRVCWRDAGSAPSLVGRPIDFGDAQRARYRRHNVVERCFNKLKQWRGIGMRTDKLARNYHAGLRLASALHWHATTFSNTP